jgi:hypothetical protein
MAIRTPSNVRGFLERFPDWPRDSLEQRSDIEAGSRWTIRDIGTFQILRLEIRRDFPRWLQDRYEEARESVRASTEVQRAIQLLRTNWRGLSRAALIEASGSFGAFFSLLAEVIEQPPTPMPDRYLRSDISPTGQIPQSSQESSSSGQSSLPSSPLERPPKRMRGQRYSDRSDSYHPSNHSGDESEQSRYDEQIKAELVTNGCFYHFLECVTENSRRVGDGGFRLEWALTQDSFHVRTPQSHFSSKNDGGLVHRGNISGQWKRQSDISYCSIEISNCGLLIVNI